MRNDATMIYWTNSAVWCLFAQPEMRAVFMEVANVLGEEPSQVALVHWDNVVKQVAPTASDPALRCSYFASVIALPLRRNASPDLQSALGRTSDYTVPNTWWQESCTAHPKEKCPDRIPSTAHFLLSPWGRVSTGLFSAELMRDLSNKFGVRRDARKTT
jgi:hypothetical protein